MFMDLKKIIGQGHFSTGMEILKQIFRKFTSFTLQPVSQSGKVKVHNRPLV